MRLWHEELIPHLPRQQLLGQHRECCALRGRGWGRPHSVVNYVFTYSPAHLIAYHYLIMDEMLNRGYNPDKTWYNPFWRGSTLREQQGWAYSNEVNQILSCSEAGINIYSEHNDAYLQECIENLKSKGINIEI